MRVAVVFDNFGPYHVARLAAAASSIDLLGIEVSATSHEYSWEQPAPMRGLRRVVLLDDGARRSDWPVLLAAYEDRVGRWRPDVIALPGWSSPAALAGLRWAQRRGIATIVMSDTNAMDAPRRTVTEFLKRRLVAQFQAGLVAGSLAKSYLGTLGLAPDQIFLGYDVVDNEYFAGGAARVREQGIVPPGLDPSWRGRFFLASARFVEKKNLPLLIGAFAQYRRMGGADAWGMVLLGDGLLRGELEQLRAAHGLQGTLFMPGFIQYGELPLFYGSAGAFVHASTTEQWGLVVNEAMASGLPVIISDRCGCVADLIEEGRNGYSFDPCDQGRLVQLMLAMASEDAGRAGMSVASRDIVARWSPMTFTDGLWRAAEAALRVGSPRSGLIRQILPWALAHR